MGHVKYCLEDKEVPKPRNIFHFRETHMPKSLMPNNIHFINMPNVHQSDVAQTRVQVHKMSADPRVGFDKT
uniref:Putative ovule protein n=1 Tax=Solanum chacoense TaxID=4108 RepID=A0A0V0GWN5_SOLCH